MMRDARTDREFDKFISDGSFKTAVRIDKSPFKEIRFDPNDSAPIYIGINKLEQTVDDDRWVIFKFTYSGENVTVIERAIGSWTGRASLF